MKKIALILTILIGSIASASAACTPPAVMHDFPGTSFNMSMATAADGNCASSVTVQSGGVASGAIASGAVASGAVVDLGAQADSAAAADTSTASLIALIKRNNQNLTTINSTAAAAVPAGTNRIGYTSDDPCNNASAKVYTAINMVTATNTVIAGVAAKNKYICSIFLYPAAADNVAIYQATTGTACATAQVAILGGTTTATGFVMTAQAGFVVGTGSAAVAKTTVVNTDICVTTSAAVQLSGAVVTADQ